MGHLAAPARHGAVAAGGQHPVPDGGGVRRGAAARRVPGLVCGHTGIPRAPLAAMGASAAHGHARLCSRLRDGGLAGLRRPHPDFSAPVAADAARLQCPPSPLGGDHPVSGALSLCLHARPAGLRGPGPGGAGAGPDPGGYGLLRVLAGGTAHGAARYCCRAGPGVDGNPGGLRCGQHLQLRYIHHGHLQELVRPVQPAGSRPARLPAIAVCGPFPCCSWPSCCRSAACSTG